MVLWWWLLVFHLLMCWRHCGIKNEINERFILIINVQSNRIKKNHFWLKSKKLYFAIPRKANFSVTPQLFENVWLKSEWGKIDLKATNEYTFLCTTYVYNMMKLDKGFFLPLFQWIKIVSRSFFLRLPFFDKLL